MQNPRYLSLLASTDQVLLTARENPQLRAGSDQSPRAVPFPQNQAVRQATGVVGVMASGCAMVGLILVGIVLLLFGACAMLIATSSFH